jgi:2-haloacid dehalogenase
MKTSSLRREESAVAEKKIHLIQAIAFDSYGTLFDVNQTNEECEKQYPGEGEKIAPAWRQKKLQYSWLRALMDRYVDFKSITKDALTFVLKENQLPFDENVIDRLTSVYLSIRPYPDVADGLRSLKSIVRRLAVLVNGTENSLRQAIDHAGFSSMFERVISVDQIKTYKPSPRVYELVPKELGISEKERILFVSGNTWDVAGAKSFGLPAVWINRTGQREFDEFGVIPDFRVTSMNEIVDLLST